MAKTGTAFLALVAGVAIGAGLGVLFAPEKGKDTRKKIKNSVGDSMEKLKEKLDLLSCQMKEKSSELTDDFEGKVEDLLSKSSYKAEEIITILEKKLASLKSANAKLQK